MRDDPERLRDTRDEFQRDEMFQVWALHHLQTIGEASRCLTLEFRQRHPDKVWAKAAGMRNILVHHYFEIDPDQVWRVIEQDLPALKEKIIAILQSKDLT